ncbi:MAG: hypothetical protein COZ06_09105 [Armatimonadetes bacterium CG_4_10_14_3_um_filter_66_18]|nr:hypothetical protein [Armatimonadota bacterium]OIP03289.1 MAG: hypothetical protein AUJ96_14825 [Armatimonadetes bacterium CG2_30_66_41]PIU94034.1 MAG: hypothetical protein COS65_09770 [Armatimonadetes bacterium CG06_land_8_20_14_3_00_66_21]PIX47009.1 MAG: hypothetical protein COZ57_09585 [Armatimonadetes bacterium CG_4_8_14_3_um_filter_66_20]PIY50492.1 MAG: hypothetical protein COZ06_09105 [Armatimonadetes bacterium CG_4_10_14_3_um_filter_66_18]PIZ51497.1 MAG: hypothetical protein COY42_00
MTLPNADEAQTDTRKLTSYLLNAAHRRGGTKARLLVQFGHHREDWRRLESDIRASHLNAEVDATRQTSYGVRYEIRAPRNTPVGRPLRVRTVWQIDKGARAPRLLTLFPD